MPQVKPLKLAWVALVLSVPFTLGLLIGVLF